MSQPEHEGTIAQFAENNGKVAEARVRSRITQDRMPSTAASTSRSWVNWGSEEQYLGQPWDAARIPLAKLEQMRRDPILAFALMFVKVPLIRAPWYIKSADPRVAAAVDASLRRIYGRFILAYTNSFDYGFSPIVKRFVLEDKPDWTFVEKDNAMAEEQPVWTDPVVKPVVWKPFTALNPRRCVPHWNSKGEFAGIDFGKPGGISPFGWSGYTVTNQMIETQKRIPDVAMEWALWATNEKDSEFGSLWGYPRIGYAYRFWWDYWHKFSVSARAFEKWGDPPVIVYHPDDPTDVDENEEPINHTQEALALAESLRSGANVSLPSKAVTGFDDRASNLRSWMVEQMEVKTNFAGIVEQFEYLDVQKLRSVMVPEQALVEGKGGTSSRNVAATFGDLFVESQAVVKAEIDDHLNRFVIPQFVELNFGPNAARAEIVTTGFDAADLESMREVVRLIGQRKILSIVDEREVLERMGLPTVSRKEMNQRLAQVAEEAETSAPAPVDAEVGASEASGVTDNGRYYGPRERIVLGNTPYVVERVDELPMEIEQPSAYFSTENRTLYIRKDADPDEVRGYVLQLLSEKATDGGNRLPEHEELTTLLEELKAIGTNFSQQPPQAPNIHVQLPEQKQKRLKFNRNEDGLLESIEPLEEGETDE